MRYLFLQILLFFSVSCNEISNQQTKPDWNQVGGRYWKHGEMLAYGDYWVEVYRDSIDNNNLVLLINKEKGYYVSDSLKIEPLVKGTAIDYGSVLLNGQIDRSLIVIYVQSDSNFHSNILKAWRANSTTGKFEMASVQGIQVETLK